MSVTSYVNGYHAGAVARNRTLAKYMHQMGSLPTWKIARRFCIAEQDIVTQTELYHASIAAFEFGFAQARYAKANPRSCCDLVGYTP